MWGSISPLRACGSHGVNGMAKQWYVATVKPMREKLAETELRKQIRYGVVARVFNPRCRVRVKQGEDKFRIKQYIQGYILVQFDVCKHRWQSVNGTRGVGRLIMCGEMPSRVRHGVVEALLHVCDGGETFVHDERLDKIISERLDPPVVGSRASVGLVSGTVHASSHARVGIMLEMFGRKLVASAPTSLVQTATIGG